MPRIDNVRPRENQARSFLLYSFLSLYTLKRMAENELTQAINDVSVIKEFSARLKSL